MIDARAWQANRRVSVDEYRERLAREEARIQAQVEARRLAPVEDPIPPGELSSAIRERIKSGEEKAQASSKQAGSEPSQCIERALVAYCRAAQKRFSIEAANTACLQVAAGLVSSDELITRLERITEVVARNTTADNEKLPGPFALISEQQWRSPVAAFQVSFRDCAIRELQGHSEKPEPFLAS